MNFNGTHNVQSFVIDLIKLSLSSIPIDRVEQIIKFVIFSGNHINTHPNKIYIMLVSGNNVSKNMFSI